MCIPARQLNYPEVSFDSCSNTRRLQNKLLGFMTEDPSCHLQPVTPKLSSYIFSLSLFCRLLYLAAHSILVLLSLSADFVGVVVPPI